MDQTMHRLAETFGIVTPMARQRKLPPPLRQMHQLILRHFAEHATAPKPRQLRECAHQLDIELGEALDQLVSVDLIEADPATAQLLGAYPFSAIPRGHKVELAGGPTVEAYCAIDALGIPAMLNRDVVISSQDPDTGEPIRITVTNGQASWRPDEAVVVLGSGPGCGPSACHRCPFITFHSSSATAAAHLQGADLAGEILTQPQALGAGALLFGDLLRPVVESANRASETGGADELRDLLDRDAGIGTAPRRTSAAARAVSTRSGRSRAHTAVANTRTASSTSRCGSGVTRCSRRLAAGRHVPTTVAPARA